MRRSAATISARSLSVRPPCGAAGRQAPPGRCGPHPGPAAPGEPRARPRSAGSRPRRRGGGRSRRHDAHRRAPRPGARSEPDAVRSGSRRAVARARARAGSRAPGAQSFGDDELAHLVLGAGVQRLVAQRRAFHRSSRLLAGAAGVRCASFPSRLVRPMRSPLGNSVAFSSILRYRGPTNGANFLFGPTKISSMLQPIEAGPRAEILPRRGARSTDEWRRDDHDRQHRTRRRR